MLSCPVHYNTTTCFTEGSPDVEATGYVFLIALLPVYCLLMFLSFPAIQFELMTAICSKLQVLQVDLCKAEL